MRGFRRGDQELRRHAPNHCAAEAKALIEANRDIAEALVYALVQTGEMTGDEVDVVIAEAIAKRQAKVEQERRAEWRARQSNAASFICQPISDR